MWCGGETEIHLAMCQNRVAVTKRGHFLKSPCFSRTQQSLRILLTLIRDKMTEVEEPSTILISSFQYLLET